MGDNMNKKSNIGWWIAGAAALFLLKKKAAAVEGIGATKKQKRRIWSEVEQAQKHGIDLSDPEGWKGNEETLSWMSHGKLSASKSSKSDEERYFEQLRKAYRSIAGTNLPYKENVVRNENGDVILIYRDYEMDKLPQKAADFVMDRAESMMRTDPQAGGYWATIACIANGLKLIWKGDGKIHRGVEQLVFGSSAPAERKLRISYLASQEKGGVYPEKFAHRLWEESNAESDDQEITDGVLDAIRDCDSRGTAIRWCEQEYLKAHQIKEPLLYQDVPF